MSKNQYVNVIVVDPSGIEYEVELNPMTRDSDLLKDLISISDLNLDQGEAAYKLRQVHRGTDGKIRENSVIVIDLAKQGNVGKVSKRS